MAQVFETGKPVSTVDVSEWTFGDLKAWIWDAEDSGLQVMVTRRSIPARRKEGEAGRP